MGRGVYLCIEGLNGSGKSTLVEVLADQLRSEGDLVSVIGFPSTNLVGEVARGLIRGDKMNMNALIYLMAADGELNDRTIRTWLRQGRIVISDRHPVLPALVYQSGAMHSSALFKSIIHSVCASIVPVDVLALIDVPAEVAIERTRQRSKYTGYFETEELAVVERRREVYRELIEDAQYAVSRSGWTTILSGEESVENQVARLSAHIGKARSL